MNEKVECEKTEVPENTNMNDRDFLNDILESEKNISNNLSIALNEASCEDLFSTFYDIYDECQEAQRLLFDLVFKKGWYTLEKATDQKIDEKYNELSQKLNQLS